LHRFCLIHPCDRQTDRQTDRRTELRWLRRAIAVPAVARKNEKQFHITISFLSSAGTNRLPVPLVKVTTVANQPGFPGCRPTDLERSTRRRDFSRIVIHLPSAT